MGVRKTNCRGRLAKSGMTVGSLPQLANVLTIQEVQNCKRCTSTNSSSPKKLSYLFGLPLTNVPRWLRRRLFSLDHFLRRDRICHNEEPRHHGRDSLAL